MNENARMLALLEVGHADAVYAQEDLKQTWRNEDAARALERAAIWERHEQGARDRDVMRVRLGGAPLLAETLAKDVPADSGSEAAGPDAEVTDSGEADEVKVTE